MEIKRLKKSDEEFPEILSRLPQPVKTLNVLGNIELLNSKVTVLGIVGSRKVSAYGRAITERFAASLARAGVCIVSGLALGVDSIAHEATLDASGKTIAVLPSGLGNIYPASHRGLAKSILAKNSLLVSEYPDDFMPRKESFIERNRIIAALSDALLVTEAAERSGSLYTARFALEMGKTVLAVPGSINSATSAGTNNLLKMGAIMVTDEQDIFDAMDIKQKSTVENLELFGDTNEETALIKLLQSGIASGDELLTLSELEVQLFQQTLTMLEIKGLVAPLGNNHWQLK